MRIKDVKHAHLNKLADYTRTLYRKPELRKLFFELTLQCNERCFHCGSSCTAARGDELSREEWLALVDQVKADFGTERIQLCITGGEPLLNRDFFDIMGHAHAQGAGHAHGIDGGRLEVRDADCQGVLGDLCGKRGFFFTDQQGIAKITLCRLFPILLNKR